MKILLLGKDGQLGRALMQVLPVLGEFVALGRQQLNLADLCALRTLLLTERPDLIINAAAYTAVDNAENDSMGAYLINATMVDVLASYCEQQGVLLIHYSTDYVFDGCKHGAYIETDDANPLNVYGASKRAGELFVMQRAIKHLIFRTSWIYSPIGSNFIRSIITQAQEKQRLSVVGDQFGTPTSAEWIAEVTMLSIIAYYKKELPNGVYHLVASGTTQWHEYACYIVAKVQAMGVPLLLNEQHILKVTTEQYPRLAKRPQNACLDNRKLFTTLSCSPPEWYIGVDAVIESWSF